MSKEKETKKVPRKTAGRVRGPVQVMWAESISPIQISTESITRCCVTNEKDEDKERTFGTKYRIPYALYRFHIFLSPSDAEKSNFDEKDLITLENSLVNLIRDDRSSMRGEMTVRHVFRFKHESNLGNAPSWKLFDRILVELKPGVDSPQSFNDYVVTLNKEEIPAGVSLEEIELTKEASDGSNPKKNRIEYVVLIDVKNGNPNGNPDAGGRPRQDAYSAKGVISDVCIKRKIRNYVQTNYGKVPGNEIFFQEGHLLNDLISDPYDTNKEVKEAYEAKKKGDRKAKPEQLAQKCLCEKYYDIRTFGAVLTTGDTLVDVSEDSNE